MSLLFNIALNILAIPFKREMKIIRGMYTDTKSSLKMTESITDYFTINRGVRRDDSLIPTLFNIYIQRTH
jgi:hypothetical protein